MIGDRWRFWVRGYYSDAVKLPKMPCALAFSTVHATEHSRDVEIAAAKARDDIGKVESGEL